MNASSIKTVLVLAVLGAVGYGMYMKLNNDPNSTAPPKGADEWAGRPPKVELPGANPAAPTFPGGAGNVATSPNNNANRPFALSIPGPGQTSNSPGPGQKDVSSLQGAPLTPSYPGRAELATVQGGRLPGSPANVANATNVTPWPNPTSSAPPQNNAPAFSPQNIDPNVIPVTASGAAMAGDRQDEEARRAFAALMDAAIARANKGELAEVHLTLSEWYGDPRLRPEQSRQLSELLSQLAGTVIYSRQSFLERPYVVRFGDTMEGIGQAYNVPGQMLAKINAIGDSADLQPGRELKVVRGPFNAIVDLNRYELVLMLDGRYAGRFAIGLGRDCPSLERQYMVRNKMNSPAVAGPNSAPGAVRPLGNRWIELDGGLHIQGTSAAQDIGRNDGRGEILVAERDMEELCDILTVGTNGSNGSTVIIRR